MRIRQAYHNNHFPEIIILLSALVVGAGGCAMPPPGGTVSIPGAPPKAVNIILTSGLKHRPFTPEELARPGTQDILAQCERQGGSRCRETGEPVDSRTQFVRGQDDKVIAVLNLGGVQLGRDYDVEWRLFNPDGELQARITHGLHVPSAADPNIPLIYVFTFTPVDPATWQLGQWRLMISVNGQKEADRSFTVVEATS